MKNPWLKRKEDKEEALFSGMMQQVCIDVKDDYIMGLDMVFGTAISNTSGYPSDDTTFLIGVDSATISNTPGYPSDDMNSLCQLSSGDVNLDYWYNSQFVSNEVLDVMNSGFRFTSYSISHTPITPGTVSGLISFDENNKYSFNVSLDGTFSYHRIGLLSDVNFIPLSAISSLDVTTGILKLEWCGKTTPEVKISYEYDLEGKI